MHDDEFDDGLDFDEQALKGFDEIESQFTTTARPLTATNGRVSSGSATSKGAIDAKVFDLESDDDIWSAVADDFENEAPARTSNGAVRPAAIKSVSKPAPIARFAPTRPSQIVTQRSVHAGPSRPSESVRRPTSNATSRQTTLFGDVLAPPPTQGVLIQANRPNGAVGPATQSSSHRITQDIAAILGTQQSSTSQQNKRKQWDFAQPINAPKKAVKYDPDGDLDEWNDFADVPAKSSNFVRAPDPVPADIDQLRQMKVQIDREAAKTWIYPTNKEKRDYQFNIVQRALFNNVLVALPTGLGKTFIAAVVILNYFRWFPQGKIIFVAPTKPLVAQQQLACHGICGLPWDTATEMTGEMKASLRAQEWQSKRIFYMTPQTFENDLCSSAVDAHDVVCIVVDEAHRATGNYAYGKVIRHLMQRNQFFRVLALTATPGSNSDKVQEVVDSLHINLIEIRQEDALDIRRYVHSKDEDPVVVPLTGVVAELRNMLASLMRPHMDTLQSAGLLNVREAASVTSFGVRSIYRDPRKKDIVQKRKLYKTIEDLGQLAQAMEYLIKYSVSMFASRMWGLETGVTTTGKKASTKREQMKYQANTIIREMRRHYEECQDSEGVVPHPKMDYLQNVIAAHFAQHDTQDGQHGRETRVMVFCSLRECVMEIVTLLNRVPAVKATQFVGQATDSKGNRGLRQKDQEKIVADFKRGDFNVLVATSIGEEGLDIGEVDLIVCYEAVKNAVRMLQRVGRTGRKREGRIVVLMSEGPEERNWQQSKDQYKTIQHDIIKGINLSLFDDVERLVPPDISSVAVEQDVDQPPFEPSMIREASKSRRSSAAAKRTRNTDPFRNVPKDAKIGFVRASDLRKGKKKGKQATLAFREGDDDADAESGPSSRSLLDDSILPILDSLSEGGDSEEELERGLDFDRPHGSLSLALDKFKAPASRGRSLGAGRIKDRTESRSSVVDRSTLSTSDELDSVNVVASVGIGDDIDMSPEGTKEGDRHEEMAPEGSTRAFTNLTASGPLMVTDASSSPVLFRARRQGKETSAIGNAFPLSDSDTEEEKGGPLRRNVEESPAIGRTKRKLKRPTNVTSSSPQSKRANTMGPPVRRTDSGEGKRKSTMRSSEKPTSVKRAADRRGKKIIGRSPNSRQLFRFEADRSTDDERHGEGDEDDEKDDQYVEDSSDREHVGDFAPTQAPKGYKQQAVYLQSLNSQFAPSIFGQKAGRAQRDGLEPGNERRKPATPRDATSSSVAGYEYDGDEGNEYEKGSFVCSDEEIVFESDVDFSQSLG